MPVSFSKSSTSSCRYVAGSHSAQKMLSESAAIAEPLTARENTNPRKNMLAFLNMILPPFFFGF
jgi:hypothetical protein